MDADQVGPYLWEMRGGRREGEKRGGGEGREIWGRREGEERERRERKREEREREAGSK